MSIRRACACGAFDNSTCSVLFVGDTSSLYINPVILVQGGIHEIALLLLFRKSSCKKKSQGGKQIHSNIT